MIIEVNDVASFVLLITHFLAGVCVFSALTRIFIKKDKKLFVFVSAVCFVVVETFNFCSYANGVEDALVEEFEDKTGKKVVQHFRASESIYFIIDNGTTYRLDCIDDSLLNKYIVSRTETFDLEETKVPKFGTERRIYE